MKTTNPNDGIQTNLTYKNACVVIEDTAMLATRDFAIVELECMVNGVFFRSQGSSRRFLGDKKLKADKPNKDVGIGLALSRALASMSKKIERQAIGQSTHAENMRKIKEVKAKKETKKAKKDNGKD